MNVILDECLPRTLKRLLVGHYVRTVGNEGWNGIKNGELLRLVETRFERLRHGRSRIGISTKHKKRKDRDRGPENEEQQSQNADAVDSRSAQRSEPHSTGPSHSRA